MNASLLSAFLHHVLPSARVSCSFHKDDALLWPGPVMPALLHLLFFHPCFVKMMCSRALKAEFGVKRFCI